MWLDIYIGRRAAHDAFFDNYDKMMKDIKMINNEDLQDILDKATRYRLRAHRRSRGHYLAAARAERMHTFLGVPVVVASTIVGTTIFATLSEQPDLALRIATGLLSIAAAVLAALQTFFKFAERAAKHRATAAKYAALYRNLDLYRLRLAQPAAIDRTRAVEELERQVAAFDQLEGEGLLIPDALYDRAVREQEQDKEGV